MENPVPEKRPKFERTTHEQLQFYVQFCKENPALQKGKNCPNSPKSTQQLWAELADSLNAMRGPTRTAAKWKESVSQWKNQIRSRARKAQAEASLTGGGPHTPDVTDFEQQAIQTFGAAAVHGNPKVRNIGHEEPNNNIQNPQNSEEHMPLVIGSSQCINSATNSNTTNSVPVESANSAAICNTTNSVPESANSAATSTTTNSVPESENSAETSNTTSSVPVESANLRGKNTQAVAALKKALESLEMKKELDAKANELLISTLKQLNESVIGLTKIMQKINSNLELE